MLQSQMYNVFMVGFTPRARYRIVLNFSFTTFSDCLILVFCHKISIEYTEDITDNDVCVFSVDIVWMDFQ